MKIMPAWCRLMGTDGSVTPAHTAPTADPRTGRLGFDFVVTGDVTVCALVYGFPGAECPRFIRVPIRHLLAGDGYFAIVDVEVTFND